MPQIRRLARCRFLPYTHARRSSPPRGTLWIDVGPTAAPPLDQLSPSYVHGSIPVPGMPGMTADSVEGIWQGLKVIRGKIAPQFFEGRGKKRAGEAEGHKYGNSNRLLGLVDARRKIYIPAYHWVLDHRVDPDVLNTFIYRAFCGIPQFFYDREDNGAIGKTQPLAYARILVDHLNQRMEEWLG